MNGLLQQVMSFNTVLHVRGAVCTVPCLVVLTCGDGVFFSLPGNTCDIDILWHGGAQIVHMDIKSVNVLLQDRSNRVAKIADLGVSKYLKGSLLDYTYRGVKSSIVCFGTLGFRSAQKPVHALTHWAFNQHKGQCIP